MAEMRFLSKIEQAAAFLRAELAGGRWEGSMPGRVELAAELGLNEWIVEDALRLLEREGVLVPQGAGRRRLISTLEKPVRAALKVRILLYERIDQGLPYHVEQAFIDELNALGIVTSSFNLPVWGHQSAGFHRCLDSLFPHTPPTALILSEARLFIAAHLHLTRQGIVVPRDVSLVSNDPDVVFSWCEPKVSHIRWDSRPLVNRMVRWADRVARGEEDRRQSATLAEFVEGGTIGPVKP